MPSVSQCSTLCPLSHPPSPLPSPLPSPRPSPLPVILCADVCAPARSATHPKNSPPPPLSPIDSIFNSRPGGLSGVWRGGGAGLRGVWKGGTRAPLKRVSAISEIVSRTHFYWITGHPHTPHRQIHLTTHAQTHVCAYVYSIYSIYIAYI
jgi:hypothetical protein